VNEWQPIETAPKDRPIFLYADGSVWVSEWCPFDPEFDEPGEEPYWRMVQLDEGISGGYGIEGYSLDLHPTHWMPLPAPPAG
jgi:hypothetical protein